MEAIQGLDEAILTITKLPNAARFEFQDMLGKLGRDILAIQRGRVARDTGALAAGLSSELLVDGGAVRLRVGLLGTAATSRGAQRRAQRRNGGTPGDPRNLGDLYYGRFVEFGRHAGKVAVERRRRVNGKLRTEPGSRGRRKRIEDFVGEGGSYKLPITAIKARPFVNVAGGPEHALIAQRTTDFWERALSRAGVA